MSKRRKRRWQPLLLPRKRRQHQQHQQHQRLLKEEKMKQQQRRPLQVCILFLSSFALVSFLLPSRSSPITLTHPSAPPNPPTYAAAPARGMMSARIDTLGLGSSSEEEEDEGEDEEEEEGGGRSILPGSAADLLRQTRVS